jgi:NitT/TauT family transport system permease protein
MRADAYRVPLKRFAPVVTIALVLVAWQLAVSVGRVPGSILPPPGRTFVSLWGWISSGRIWPHFWATVSVALGGYALGSAFAVLLAALMSLFTVVYRHLAVLVICVQAIPKVALAPLMFIWLGFGPQTGIALVALSCFYPMLVNSMEGFRSTNPDMVTLYRSFDSGRVRTFLAVAFPSALPQMFVGLEISVVFALISAVVMEFIASPRGLGFLIQDASNTLDTATVFASIFLLAATGIGLSATVRFLKRRIVFWIKADEAAAKTETA